MQIHDTAFIAPGAVVLGDVTIGENSGIWYNAVVRGDRLHCHRQREQYSGQCSSASGQRISGGDRRPCDHRTRCDCPRL